MFSTQRTIRLPILNTAKLNTAIASSIRHSRKVFIPRRSCSTETSAERMAAHNRAVSAYVSQSHEKIFENNRKWVASKKEADPEFFDKLAAGQTPEYLYVSFHFSSIKFLIGPRRCTTPTRLSITSIQASYLLKHDLELN